MRKVLIVAWVLIGCVARLSAQSVSIDFTSFPAGTPASELSVGPRPNIVFLVNPGASAQIDDRPAVGRALIYTQQVAMNGLPRSQHLIVPAGLEIRFIDWSSSSPQLMRMAILSFDWAVKGRTHLPPTCIVDQSWLVMDSGQAPEVTSFGGYIETLCPPPGVPGWSGSYLTGHFDSATGFLKQRAFTTAGLVFPSTTPEALADTEFLLFNLQATIAPACALGAPAITSPSNAVPVIAGSSIPLTWSPANGLNLDDGSYVVETSLTNSFAVREYQKGTFDTSLSVPIKASDVDYTLYIRVWAFEICWPGWGIGGADRGGYIYGVGVPLKFVVKGVPSRPAIQRPPPRPPVRRVGF